MMIYKPGEFAKLIGIHIKTLQKWDRDGKLKAYRTPTNRRFYTHSQYVEYVNNTVATVQN
jgi:DNA-binding transcriptional MerR regulator